MWMYINVVCHFTWGFGANRRKTETVEIYNETKLYRSSNTNTHTHTRARTRSQRSNSQLLTIILNHQPDSNSLRFSVSHHANQMLVFATLFLFRIWSFSLFHFICCCLCLLSARSYVAFGVCCKAIKRKKIVYTQHDFSRLDRFLFTYLCLSVVFSIKSRTICLCSCYCYSCCTL